MAAIRTSIEIVGLSKRMTGTSAKTGRPYDFQTVSFIYADKYTTGMAAGTCTLNGETLDAVTGGLMIGSTYDAVVEKNPNNSHKIHAII